MNINLDKVRKAASVLVLSSGGGGSVGRYRNVGYGLSDGDHARWLAGSPEFGVKYAGRNVVPWLRLPGGGWPNMAADFDQFGPWEDSWVDQFIAAIASAPFPAVGLYFGCVRGMVKPERFGSVMVRTLERLYPVRDRVLIGFDECNTYAIDSPEHPQMLALRMFIGAGFPVFSEQGVGRHQEAWFPDVAGFITASSELRKRDAGTTNDFVPLDGNGKVNVIWGEDVAPVNVPAWAESMRRRGFIPAPEATSLSVAQAAAFLSVGQS